MSLSIILSFLLGFSGGLGFEIAPPATSDADAAAAAGAVAGADVCSVEVIDDCTVSVVVD